MEVTTWYIRSNAEKVDPVKLYDKSPSLFSLEIHHGGAFSKGLSRSYVDGKVSYVDFIDGDEFSVLELNAMMKELGYVKKAPMWYHFKTPDSDLDFGLHALGSDNDVRFLLKFVCKHKLIEVYVEEWKTNLNTYTRRSPQTVVIDEQLEDNPVVPPPTARKKLFTNLSGQDETAPNLNDVYIPMQVETEGGQGSRQDEVEPNLNDDFFNDVFLNDAGMAIGVESQVGQSSRSGVNEDLHDKSGTNSDSGEDSGEDSREDSGEDSGEDSDFVMDDEHRIQEVDVDMADFRNNIDVNVEWLPNREDIPDNTSDDIDIQPLNFDNIDSQSDSEDDDRTQALKRLRKEHNTNPDKQAHFYPGQVFGTKHEIKELVTRLAVETRRQLKIVKNDKAGVVKQCGNCKQDGHNRRTCPRQQAGGSSSTQGGTKATGSKAGGSKAGGSKAGGSSSNATKVGNKKAATKKAAKVI